MDAGVAVIVKESTVPNDERSAVKNAAKIADVHGKELAKIYVK